MDQASPNLTLGVDELEALFKFIPSDQLLGLRQVSAACNEAALPVLRKRRDLNFTLTIDQQRNKNFLDFLRALPENGFVASGMKLKFPSTMKEMVRFSLRDCYFKPFQEGVAEICNEIGTRQMVKKFTLELQLEELVCISFNQSRMNEFIIRTIGQLSPSLEIIDLEKSCLDFGLRKEAYDSELAFFRNSPLNNLKRIVTPSDRNMRIMVHSFCFNGLKEWLNILVQSAPKLLEDPRAILAQYRNNEEESSSEEEDQDANDENNLEDVAE